jgi:hypothetical protein
MRTEMENIIMANINIHNETNINGNGEHIHGNSKAVYCITDGITYHSLTDAAEAVGVSIYTISNAINDRQRTAGGKEWCLLSKVSENMPRISKRVIQLSEHKTINETNANKARMWDAMVAKAEQRRAAEAERKALEEELAATMARLKTVNAVLAAIDDEPTTATIIDITSVA